MLLLPTCMSAIPGASVDKAMFCHALRIWHVWSLLQECDELMVRGIGGTGEGFDAPSAGRLGGRGFGTHNDSPAALRSAMVKVPHPLKLSWLDEVNSYSLSRRCAMQVILNSVSGNSKLVLSRQLHRAVKPAQGTWQAHLVAADVPCMQAVRA